MTATSIPAVEPTEVNADGARRFEDLSGMPPATDTADSDGVVALNEEGAIACGHAEVAVITFLNEGATPEVSRAAADAADAATVSGISALVAAIPKLRVDIEDSANWEQSMVQFLEACQTLGYEIL